MHNNTLDPYPRAGFAIRRASMVSAMHVPPYGASEQSIYADPRSRSFLTVMSRVQLRRWWEHPPATASVVSNAVGLLVSGERRGGAVWIGRILPTKVPELATRGGDGRRGCRSRCLVLSSIGTISILRSASS